MNIQAVLGYGAVLIGMGSMVVSGVLWNIIKAYKERVDQLEAETKRCAADHLVSQGQIKELKEQVREFKDLPLKQIQDTQARILETQKQIVELLTKIEDNQ